MGFMYPFGILDFDIYCGKQETHCNETLSSCNVGTKAVMKMVHNFLLTVSKTKLVDYHVCFDNFFTSPDLLLHLKNLGLKATGTVREDRVYEMVISKKISKSAKKLVLHRTKILSEVLMK